jgi:serine O-acetyltransferase
MRKQRTTSTRNLLRLVREDWVTHGRSWHHPGFHAIAVYRIGVWREGRGSFVHLVVAPVYGLLRLVVRNVYGIEIPRDAKIGRRVWVTPGGGVVIAHGTEIGDDCGIRQNVTIGVGKSRGVPPRLGRKVELGAGAVVIGGTIGDGARIGPNAVIVTDVPAAATVLAPSPRVICPIDATTGDRRADPAGGETNTLAEITRSDVADVPRSEDLMDELLTIIRSLGQGREDVDVHTPLLSSGLVDSFEIAVLIQRLEDAFGITLTADDVDVESFDSPAGILAVVKHRRGD